MQNPRECALDVLIKVDKKEELSHIAISNVLEKYQFSEKRDRAFFYKTGGRNFRASDHDRLCCRSVLQRRRSENVNH